MSCVYPPTFYQHITDPDRPAEYTIFWILGGICLSLTAILIISKMVEFVKEGKEIRDKYQEILLPFSHITCFLIIAFPLISSFFCYVTLFSPITSYLQDFIITSYQGLTLYCFARLLIMLLGSIKVAMKSLKQAPPTQFWAVVPLCCCRYSTCCKAKNVDIQDFRIIFYLVFQFAVIAPIIKFSLLLRSFEGGHLAVQLLNSVYLISSMSCLYALLALLTASSFILKEFNIKGKFWCIKFIIFTMVLAPIVASSYFYLPDHNERYTHEVMVEAYASITAIVILTFLSVGFRRCFNPQDALNAYEYAKHHKHVISVMELVQTSDEYDTEDEIDKVTDCNGSQNGTIVTSKEMKPIKSKRVRESVNVNEDSSQFNEDTQNDTLKL